MFQLSCGSYTFISYKFVGSDNTLVSTSISKVGGEEILDLTQRLKKLYEDVEIQSK